MAARLLVDNGYKILNRNFYCKSGEIDIIALKDDIVAFVEVKARHSDDFGFPSEFVDSKKQANIRKCAEYYLLKNEYSDKFIRFDVISIQKNEVVEWIDNAF